MGFTITEPTFVLGAYGSRFGHLRFGSGDRLGSDDWFSSENQFGSDNHLGATALGTGPSATATGQTGSVATPETVTLAGSGLIFVNTYGSGVTATFRNEIVAAENYFQSHFTNSCTINCSFDLQALNHAYSGENSFSPITVSYSSLVTALHNHATTSDDLAAVAALANLSDPSGGRGFEVPIGEARILGLAGPGSGIDDAVVLNNFYWTAQTLQNSPNDAIAVLEHEISEGAMGRIGSLGTDGGLWAPMDLFRFTAAGQRDLTGGRDGVATYFSPNGSNVATGFQYHNSINSSGVNDGFDLSDWDQVGSDANAHDPFGPGGPGVGDPGVLSATDLRIMDVLGWTPTGAAPPTVSSVVETAPSGSVTTARTATMTLNMSTVVVVAGGTPTLYLDDGGTATYTGGSGTSALTFSYAVAAGQVIPNLLVLAVNLGSATIKDTSGNAANMSGALASEVTTNDSANAAPWSSQIAVHDGQGNLASLAVNMDNGRVWTNVYDSLGTASWTWFTDDRDATGKLVEQYGTNDDGTHWLTLYDTTNAYTWSRVTWTFNSNWSATSLSGTLDNGSSTNAPIGAGAALDVATWFQAPYDPNWNAALLMSGTVGAGGSIGASAPPPLQLNLSFVGIGNFAAAGLAGLAWQSGSGAALWNSNGTNLTQAPIPDAAMGPNWTAVGVGDFNGDGHSDLLWTDATGTAAVWEMNGTALLAKGAPAGQIGRGWGVAGVGDFNGDGKSDILWVNGGSAAVWTMNGTALSNSAAASRNMSAQWHVAAIGDFNNDGRSDVLWESTSGATDVWEMNGSNVAGFEQNVGLMPAGWRVAGVGHFNSAADASSDIVWVDASNHVQIWQMKNGRLADVIKPAASITTDWHVQGVGNFVAGDPNSELLWINNSGAAQIWKVNGTQVSEMSMAAPAGDVLHLGPAPQPQGAGGSQNLADPGPRPLGQMVDDHSALPGIGVAPLRNS